LEVPADPERRRAGRPVGVAEAGPRPRDAAALGRPEAPTERALRYDADVVHLDGAVRALPGAQLAADAPVFDDDLAVVAAVDGADRAAAHADGVQAGPARQRDQEAVETWPLQEQPAAAVVVDVHAGADALVAARAPVQVDQH